MNAFSFIAYDFVRVALESNETPSIITQCLQDEEADSQPPAKVKPQKGTRKLESRKPKSEEDEQIAGLTAALQCGSRRAGQRWTTCARSWRT